ncbi:DUF2993 domain-containing protein [Microbacterium sp. 179-B 1A2 NHS]|uniref:LmeA family phospholipid-binding protein n=1 Tax=Microbacterium sp. 179-B 1A2 NHS TaxID=3142383 RepID=UPI00399F4FC6
MTAAPATAPRRRQRGWIALAVVVVVLIVLVVAAELTARALAPKIVRDELVSSLGLAEDQEIDVDIPGLLLPQLVGGTVRSVTLAADDVEVEGLSGDIRVQLQDVPIRGGADWNAGRARVVLDEEQTRALLSQVDGFPADAFRLDAPEVALDTELTVFGAAIPLGVRLSAGAEDGDLVLAPTRFLLGGTEVSADALRQQVGPLIGSFAERWPICLAQYLPAAMTLVDVAIEDRGVVADFEIDSAILRDGAARQRGSCDDA